MNYTEEQKEIIRELAESKYSNIRNYLLSRILETDILSIDKNDNSHKQHIDNLYNKGVWHLAFDGMNNNTVFVRTNTNTFKMLTDFLSVIVDLKIKILIFTITEKSPNTEKDLKLFLSKDIQSEIYQRMFNIRGILRMGSEKVGSFRLPDDEEISYHEIYYPLPALQEFINNDFMTAEELKHEAQTKNQKDQLELQVASLKLTRIIAYFTIGVTTLVSIVPFIYSLCTTKASENNVTIKNPQDTIKVINITPIKPILKDSVKADTNRK